MKGLFQGFINAIKAKFISIVTKLKLLTNPTYVKNEILKRLILYFREFTNVRPKDKNDYYGIFGWLVSKRLAFFIVVFIGLASAYYLTILHPISTLMSSENGIKTYDYNSIPLRFTEGNVRILGKSKYLAYEGSVKGGYAQGNGTLYRKDGTKVYEGKFENSLFQGTGISYYPTEQVQYTGTFQQNLYNGIGKLYRTNGSLEYSGEFLDGMKEGEGTLYDSGNNKVFVGNFVKDYLLYSDFVGKSTAEANTMYIGSKTIYTDEEYFVVDMSDINAVYYGRQGEENITDEIMVEGVYILKDAFEYSGKKGKTIAEISQIMGDVIYEGNAYIVLPEAVAIHVMNLRGNEFYGDVIKDSELILTDAVLVNEYDRDYSIYIYTYVQNGLRYTFFAKDRTGKFAMYLIEKEE